MADSSSFLNPSISNIATEEFSKGLNQPAVYSPRPTSTTIPDSTRMMTPPTTEPRVTPTSSINVYQLMTKSWVWGIIVTLFLIIFLYRLNPPIVQHPRVGTQQLECPKPNIRNVLILSLIGGMGVFLGPYIVRWI